MNLERLAEAGVKVWTKQEILKQWTTGYMSMFQMCGQLPNRGVGYRFYRKTWPENSYYELSTIKLKDPGHGKAWGYFVWKGERSEQPLKVRSPLKRGIWQYTPPS
jgi:small subunit ribosomal protein S34